MTKPSPDVPGHTDAVLVLQKLKTNVSDQNKASLLNRKMDRKTPKFRSAWISTWLQNRRTFTHPQRESVQVIADLIDFLRFRELVRENHDCLEVVSLVLDVLFVQNTGKPNIFSHLAAFCLGTVQIQSRVVIRPALFPENSQKPQFFLPI